MTIYAFGLNYLIFDGIYLFLPLIRVDVTKNLIYIKNLILYKSK